MTTPLLSNFIGSHQTNQIHSPLSTDISNLTFHSYCSLRFSTSCSIFSSNIQISNLLKILVFYSNFSTITTHLTKTDFANFFNFETKISPNIQLSTTTSPSPILLTLDNPHLPLTVTFNIKNTQQISTTLTFIIQFNSPNHSFQSTTRINNIPPNSRTLYKLHFDPFQSHHSTTGPPSQPPIPSTSSTSNP